MGELYLRKVVLDIIPTSGTGKRIEDLRIKFKVEKTNESSPNDATIEIYNLSEATRSLLEGKKTKVRLSIGYLGLNAGGIAGTGVGGSSSVETVFIGDVTKTTQKIESPDIITTVECADGDNRYRNARLEKGYPPNTNLTAVFDDLGNALGLGKGPQEGIPNKKFANGLTLSGLSRDHLSTLCKSNRLEWSIQDENLQIIPEGQGTTESVILLSSDSGLIGSPNKTDKGMEFVSLIQPKLRPGRRVQVDSRILKGIFKLRKVTHEGDSHQGDFLSKCESTK